MNWRDAEPLIRLGCFSTVLLLVAIVEAVVPRRRLQCRRPMRWSSHLGLAVLNTLVIRLALPVGAVGIAVVAQSRGWGLFNNLALPTWLAVVVAFVALDFIIYLQHIMFHAVPVFWRLHMVHHADHDFDCTTGLRFHPLEMLLSMGLKCVAVVVLGAPPLAVIGFEVVLNTSSLFSHGNVRLPLRIDRVLRFILVTPDMHRIHHSVVAEETNSNFGFNFAWWDYLLGTYRPQPLAGHAEMNLGLRQFPSEQVERLPDMLGLPFLGKGGEYAINRHPASSQAGENAACGV